MSDANQSAAREYEYDAVGVHITVVCGVTPLYWCGEGKKLGNLLHSHSWFELFCPRWDSVTVCFETGVQQVHPGEAILIPPGMLHYGVFADNRDNRFGFSFFVQYQNQGEAAQVLKELLDAKNCVCFSADGVRGDLIRYLADALEQENGLLCGTYLLAFLLECARCRTPKDELTRRFSGDNKESRIYRIEQAIYANFMGKLPIKRLAEELHLSQRQVSRIVKQQYGTSYRSKNKDLRMASAAKRLEEGCNISQAAAAEGYQSLSAFYAAFRKAFGMTPAEYQKAHRK